MEQALNQEEMPTNKEILLNKEISLDASKISTANFNNHQESESGNTSDIIRCNQCNKIFTYRKNLIRHMKVQHSAPQHTCHICHKEFTRNDYLLAHIKIHNRPPKEAKPTRHPCNICEKDFSRRNTLANHMKIHSRPPKEAKPSKKIAYIPKSSTSTAQASMSKPSRHHASNLNPCLGTFETFLFHPTEVTNQDLQVFLESIKSDLIKKIDEVVTFHRGVKWYISACVKMIRMVSQTEEETCLPHFRSNCITTLRGETPDVQQAFDKTLTSLEEFEGIGSGWVIDSIQYLELKTAAYQPLHDYSSPLLKIMAKARSVF